MSQSQVSPSRPNLRDLLVAGLDAAVPHKPFFGKPYYEFTQVSTVAAYLFEQSALLGSITRTHAAEMSQLMLADWSPASVESFRNDMGRMADGRTAGLAAQARQAPNELQQLSDRITPSMFLLRTEWPEVYAPGAAFIDRPRWDARLKQRWSPAETFEAWSQVSAQGLGFGLFCPEEADGMLKAAFAPQDAERWAQARADGLNLAATPADRDIAEAAETLLEGVKALAAEYYPDLALALAQDRSTDGGAIYD